MVWREFSGALRVDPLGRDLALRMHDISIKWKSAIPIAFCVIVGIIITIVVTGLRSRDIVIKEATESTMPVQRDTVLNALTSFMYDDDYNSIKKPFLEQMSHISDIHVVRSRVLDNQYGPAEAGSYADDKALEEVIRSGKERVFVESDRIVGVYPYIAKASAMGKNCLSCHQVREGTVLGAIRISVAITNSNARIRALQKLYLVLGLAGMVLFVIVTIVVFTVTHAPLKKLTENLEEMIHKDLRVEITEKGERDEVLKISKSLDSMVRVFNEAIKKIISSSSEVSSIVDMLNIMTERTEKGAVEQSTQAAQISTVAEEMSNMINDIAKNALGATESSNEAMDVAVEGKQLTETSVEEITKAFQATLNLSDRVNSLNSNVEEISDVVTVIKGIADQTNLLALNAAIEAARAGEQGRGFAVVADEVRKLAERTIKATDEVSLKISSVQTESAQTASEMESASEMVTISTEHIKKVGAALEAIVEKVQGVRDTITHIATSVEQQSTASDEVAKNIESSAEISNSIETMARSVSKNVANLATVVQGLRDYTSEFKVQGSHLVVLDLSKNDHMGWIRKVNAHLSGDAVLNPENLADHKTCRLGKWYYTEGLQLCGDLKSFRALESVHEQVHKVGKEIIIKHNEGKTQETQQMLKDLESISAQVIDYLEKIGVEYDEKHDHKN